MADHSPTSGKVCSFIIVAAIILLGTYFRAAGLYRGLEKDVIYHPDSPKQVMMLNNYLHGNYLQYYDSLFYDGYPFGLNRVDELIIRSVQVVRRPVLELVNPEIHVPWMPPRHELFTVVRALRVFYGALGILLVFLAARAFGAGRLASYAGALVYALSPLGVAVAHSATGDIGIDLFLITMIWALAHFTRKKSSAWLAVAGFACGMAFACKYQGAMGVWILGGTVVLSAILMKHRIGTLLKQVFVALVSSLAGLLSGLPAYYDGFYKAWKATRKSFEFIKDYGVSPDFLEKPLTERIYIGLTSNVPLVMKSVGWGISIICLVATVYYLGRLLKAYKARSGTHDEDNAVAMRRTATLVAVVTFPIIATLASTAFKPAVQPFHFSYLAPVLGLATAVFLSDASRLTWPMSRLVLSVGFVFIMAFEAMPTMMREHFMWKRPEGAFEAFDFERKVFYERGWASKAMFGSRRVKLFCNDPADLQVFRNRATSIEHMYPEWWQKQHQLPVPHVPLLGMSGWIYVNGPIFPRSDRMFHVPARGPGMTGRPDEPIHMTDVPLTESYPAPGGTWTEKTLVYFEEPGSIRVGLRSGHMPARYIFKVSGQTYEGLLLPHDQVIIPIESLDAAFVAKPKEGFPGVHHVPIKFKSSLGPLWVTLLDKQLEVDHFLTFGPSEYCDQASEISDVESLAYRLEALRYFEGTNSFRLSPGEARIPGDVFPLPGGTYRLNALVYNDGEAQSINFHIGEFSGHPFDTPRDTIPVQPGINEIAWEFKKEYEPYDGNILLSVDTDDLTLIRWELKPDPSRLAEWRNRDVQPVVDPRVRSVPLGVDYEGIGRVVDIKIPEEIKNGESFRYTIGFELDDEVNHRYFHEAAIFLHVRDENNKWITGLDFPLKFASFAPSRINWQEGVLTDVDPGTYRIEGGIYNGRTRNRFDFRADDGVEFDKWMKFFQMTEIVVE